MILLCSSDAPPSISITYRRGCSILWRCQQYVVNNDDHHGALAVMLQVHAEIMGLTKDGYSTMKDDASSSVRSAAAEFATGAAAGMGCAGGGVGSRVPEFINLDSDDCASWTVDNSNARTVWVVSSYDNRWT
jgi:hypothetical protein